MRAGEEGGVGGLGEEGQGIKVDAHVPAVIHIAGYVRALRIRLKHRQIIPQIFAGIY